MKKLICAGLAVLLLSGCAVTNVGFAADPIRMTVIQRQSKRVPGSPSGLKVEIGDITGGQVLLSIRGTFNRVVADTVSVEPGDVVSFRVGSNEYFLTVIELRNLLAGDDFGVFEISAAPPAAAGPRTRRNREPTDAPSATALAARASPWIHVRATLRVEHGQALW